MSERLILRGRSIVIGIIIFTLLLSLVTLLPPLLQGVAPKITSFVRFALTIALCWQLYRAKAWARVVAIILMLLAAAQSLAGGVLLLSFSSLGLLLVVLGVAYLIAAGLLWFTREVRAYFGLATGGGRGGEAELLR